MKTDMSYIPYVIALSKQNQEWEVMIRKINVQT